MSDHKLSMIFPCSLMHRDSNLVTKKIVKLSKQLVMDYKDSPFYSKCYSTVRTNDKILDIPEFCDIKSFLNDLLLTYCESLHINSTNIEITGSWLNYYEKGGYQDLHNHQNSMISGVLWVKTDNTRDFVFQAPYHFMQPINPPYTTVNEINCVNYEIDSLVGRGLVFMSNMLHRTLPTENERISLAFNAK